MGEKVEDFEIELPEEDSPVEILNEPVGEDLFDYDLSGENSSDGLGDIDLVDMLPDNEKIKSDDKYVKAISDLTKNL